MYSLEINFLNDRQERPTDVGVSQSRGQESPRPLYMGIAVGVLLPALVVGLWFAAQQRNASLTQRQTELAGQVGALDQLKQEVAAINAQIQASEAENKALATVFNYIKPWSAILQDVRERVPAGVQVSQIEQTEPQAQPGAVPAPQPSPSPGAPPAAAPPPPTPATSNIKVTGQARTFTDVNDFLLTLQQSHFLESGETRLVSAELVDNPTQVQFAGGQSGGVQVQLPKVVRFTIESKLTNIPTSQLLQDMERTLAVGLPARIQALRDKGVIQQ